MNPQSAKNKDKVKQHFKISEFILEKLLNDFGQKPIDRRVLYTYLIKLITCYVNDYKSKYSSYNE